MSPYVDTTEMSPYVDIVTMSAYADTPMEVDTLHQLAAAARARRVELGLSQAGLAARARVSRQWVSEFEGGKETAELGLVLRLIDALDLRLQLSPVGSTPAAADDEAIDLDALLDDHRRR